MVRSSERRTLPALALETECRSDQQIAADFLAYLQSDTSDHVAYEQEPTRLIGGADARLYRYKLIGQEPRVLRVLRPAHRAEVLMVLQLVHQTLNQQGLHAPVIHRVCGDQSVLGGVFAVMELVPGQHLSAQPPEIHASVLGESMARMHTLDVHSFVETFRRAGIADEHFLFPALLQRIFDDVEQTMPWAVDLVGWLREQLPLDALDRSVIHGDYHGNNVMFEDGAITGVLDWTFAIADPAIDLANMMNVYFLFAPQLVEDFSPRHAEQIVEGVLKAYQGIKSLDHQRIKAFRVNQLLGALCMGPGAPEFMRKPESQRDYLSFIEQTTGIRVSLPA